MCKPTKVSLVTVWIMSCLEPGFAFRRPSKILIVGPTSCGKTTFLQRPLLENLDVLLRNLATKI